MKVLQFTIPVVHDQSVIVQEEQLPYFYPYLHRHAEVQITAVVEGEGTLVAGTNMFPFGPGDVFYIGANHPHVFKNNAGYFEPDPVSKVHALTVFFDPVEKLKPLFSLPEMQLVKRFFEGHLAGFKIPGQYGGDIAAQIRTMLGKKHISSMVGFLELLKLLHLAQQFIEPFAPAVMDGVSESEGIKIGNIYNYIMQHFDKDITLEEISAVAHMTPPSFCRYFKKQTGNTFVGFLNELRINEACKKLTTPGEDNISGIAYACGFNSITNFNRVFKSIAGVTPVVYLKNYKSKL
ncbi:AraC family transcriptional regulator [Niabella drilacis]|uniref:AraC-type DNA-binding protein n=1 Tax=Niabella drilacis (strain DSM 25811 / CCM 8410 / CCUG 62505 / LMG 26954 / E90) TaxID=1285928 RepID=A0A1G6R8N0_NIADE|nr:AraC family transcriptional regulator [Niabella drilacis]SDD00644.1 AraC-type DNA-binding protein [Niabella drilacis]